MSRYIGVAKAARLIGVSRSAMQKLIRSGQLHTFEGRVDVQELKERYPAMALTTSAELERVNIIKDSAFGDRVSKLVAPETDRLQTQLRRLQVDYNVERGKARAYQALVKELLEKLSELQQTDNEEQRNVVAAINVWLLERFNNANS